MLRGNSMERTTFVLSFLTGIVGSKICLTFIIEKGKKLVETKYYLRIIKSPGLILMFFGFILLKDGVVYLLR